MVPRLVVMSPLRITGLVLVAASIAGATAVAVNSASLGAEPARAAAPREPGILRYPPDAPQLAALKITAVEELPVPLAEPLNGRIAVSYTHLRAHETRHDLVCRLLL